MGGRDRAYMMDMGIDERLIFGPRAGDGVAVVRGCIRNTKAGMSPPCPEQHASHRAYSYQVTDNGEVFFDEDREGKAGVELEALMHSAVRFGNGCRSQSPPTSGPDSTSSDFGQTPHRF